MNECKPLVHGLAFLANRHIELGEEIYLDYRLLDAPAWYSPVPRDLVWRLVDELEEVAEAEAGAAGEVGAGAERG